MALKKVKSVLGGQLDAEYWKITLLAIDLVGRAMNVTISLFKSKSFSDQGASPLESHSFQMGILPGIDPIAVNPRSTELITLGYNVIKTQPMFQGSEDV